MTYIPIIYLFRGYNNIFDTRIDKKNTNSD